MSQWAVREGEVTPRQLDTALGIGAELQALISESNPYCSVQFKTAYDHLEAEPDWDFKEQKEEQVRDREH
jgi:hypothetical protein